MSGRRSVFMYGECKWKEMAWCGACWVDGSLSICKPTLTTHTTAST